MGATPIAGPAALRHRCTYSCSGSGSACGSKDSYETWLVEELARAVNAQDCAKVEEVLGIAPQLKEREIQFPGEASVTTVLGVVLNRRDSRVVRALLRAGVSPNMPISEQQRSVYAHRSQLAALNGGDMDLQNLVPSTHFEALCSTQHKELFMVLLEGGANPNSGIIQVAYCGDLEMLEALLERGGDPNLWSRQSTPLVSAVKSKLQPYDKALSLLRAGADPNNVGPPTPKGIPAVYPALVSATRKRDYRMVRILLEAGADVNLCGGEEGLPNALFWGAYWGELELIKLFVTLSKHRLDFDVRKYTNETVFDVVRTARSFAGMRKPRHIQKLPLPSRPAVVYDKILQMLEEYSSLHDYRVASPNADTSTRAPTTGATRASSRRTEEAKSQSFSSDRALGLGVAGAGALSSSTGTGGGGGGVFSPDQSRVNISEAPPAPAGSSLPPPAPAG